MQELGAFRLQSNGAPTSKRQKLINRCTFAAGQPLVSYPGLGLVTQRNVNSNPSEIRPWPVPQQYDLPALPPGQQPLLVTAVAPSAGTAITFRGLAATELTWPAVAVTSPAHSLLSVIVRGVTRAAVTKLSRDSVFGGGIYLAPADENQPYKLCYSFAALPGSQRVGFLLEKLSSSEAIIFVALNP